TIRRGAHCASDNHQELVVVKNVAIFGEIISFSVVFVFMALRHEPDAQCAPLRSGERSCAINSDLSTSASYNTVGNGLCAVPEGFHMVKFADRRTISVMAVQGTARRPFPTNKWDRYSDQSNFAAPSI
ncbi:MAG: hypothetical protein J6K89_09840, partial [Oscillospiraceae bacterium]|nr:hypothetical protein [Oscillospiraceae bacterium]